jgi:hypothetical protein
MTGQRPASFCCTLVLVLMATSVEAQRATGEIIGKITDESNAVLPGVSVTIRGAGVAGAPTVVTSETGVYRFPLLPPGTYELDYVLSGFTPLKRTGIPIAVGATVELDVSLTLGTLEETLTVSGQAPVINTASAQTSTTYNQEMMRNLPIARTSYWDVPNSAPGLVQTTVGSSQAAALGSSTNENQVHIDGTQMTSMSWLSADAVGEIEVLQLGASAEYGGVQGAVYNVVTRQGSNQFHGDLNYFYQNQALTDRNTQEDFDNGWPFNRALWRNWSSQASGPFVRDKLWFFFSYEDWKYWDSQPGTDPQYPSKNHDRRLFWKMNYQISSNHRLMHGWHDDFYAHPSVVSQFEAPSTMTLFHGHNPTLNFVYTGVFKDSTLLELKANGLWVTGTTEPLEPVEPRIKTQFVDLDTGMTTGGITQWREWRNGQKGLAAKLTRYVRNFLGGSHDLVMGAQADSLGPDVTLAGSNDVIFSLSGVPSFGTTQRPYYVGYGSRHRSAFIDDKYRVGERATLNLGVRYDYNQGYYGSFPVLDERSNPTGDMSPPNDDVFHWNVVSPRVGINYRIARQTVIKGHVGRYYGGIGGDIRDIGGLVPSTTPQFTFDVDRAGNRTNFTTQTPANLRVDPNRKNPYSDQYIAQIEHELIANLGLQINYVHKRGEDFPGWLDIAGQYVQVPYVDSVGRDATGQTAMVWRLVSPPNDRIFMLTTPPGLYTRYNGGTFVLTKRMSNNWLGSFSVVLSKAEGRISSSAASGIGQGSAAGNFGRANGPNDYVNTEGRLIGDRPVVAKATAAYNFPGQVMVSVNAVHQTGRLWSRQIRPPGLGFPSAPTIYMEAHTGDRRMPAVNIVDLRAQKSFTLAGSPARLALFVDVFNLTNSDLNENVGARLGTSAAFGVPIQFILPRRLQLGAKIVW